MTHGDSSDFFGGTCLFWAGSFATELPILYAINIVINCRSINPAVNILPKRVNATQPAVVRNKDPRPVDAAPIIVTKITI
jgi:hypothetical protein